MGNQQNNVQEEEINELVNEENNNHRAAHVQAPVIDPNKTYTKKELAKLQKKKEKADAREQMEEYLKQKKLREIEKEKIQLERDLKRKEDEAKENEIIQKMKEDKEKKEAEEFAKWEKMFQVKEEGVSKEEFNEKVITEFINYVKLRKVVSLEDIAGTFKISSKEVVNRLNDLEACGRICGVIDDRGKYIFITDKELSNIEKYFLNKGRVSKSDLVTQCNKLIRFEPTDEDKETLQKQNLSILEMMEEVDKKEVKA